MSIFISISNTSQNKHTHLHPIFRYLLTYIITANCRIINFVNTLGWGGAQTFCIEYEEIKTIPRDCGK